MKEDNTLPKHGDLRPSDLPNFIGIEPLHVTQALEWNDNFTKQSFQGRYEIRCNIVRIVPKEKEYMVSTDRILVLTFVQFKEFDKALFQGENGRVLITNSNGRIEFKPSDDCYSNTSFELITDDVIWEPSTFFGKIFSLPKQLKELLEILKDIIENHRTVKNVIQLKYDRSHVSVLQDEIRTANSLNNTLKERVESLTDNIRRNRDIANKNVDNMLINNAKYETEIAELKALLSNNEDDTLRAAEKIKSRISAEQTKIVNGV